MLHEFKTLSPTEYECKMRLLSQKPILTKREAAAFFSIGVSKMEKLLSEESPYRIMNGRKYLVNRAAFESFLTSAGRI